MPNEKTERKGFSTNEPEKERDMAAKGGPMTGPGNPDDRHGISSPYSDDLQTQIAAKGNKKQSESQKDGNSESKTK